MWEEVDYIGILGYRDYQFASRSVLKDFTDDVLTISVGSLYKNAESVLVTAGKTSLLVWPHAGTVQWNKNYFG